MNAQITDGKLRLRREAATYLSDLGYPTAPATLAKLASIGGGPIYQTYARRALYREPDLLAWALSRCSAPKRSTSDDGVAPAVAGA